MARFQFQHRLHQQTEFDCIYRQGRRYGDPYFLLLVRPNAQSHARLGLSVSAKAVGNAVNRNRVKRIIRESFRSRLPQLPPVDVVVNARAPARSAVNGDLVRSLERLWDKLPRHA